MGDDDVVAMRTIQVAERHGDDFAVTKGLKAGDRVIVEGQLKARPGIKVKPTARPVSSEPDQKKP